jgi:hypothetical protein
MREELYYGNISPNEKQSIRDTGFDQALRTLSENEEKLTDYWMARRNNS